jgi:hypothetical protein
LRGELLPSVRTKLGFMDVMPEVERVFFVGEVLLHILQSGDGTDDEPLSDVGVQKISGSFPTFPRSLCFAKSVGSFSMRRRKPLCSSFRGPLRAKELKPSCNVAPNGQSAPPHGSRYPLPSANRRAMNSFIVFIWSGEKVFFPRKPGRLIL